MTHDVSSNRLNDGSLMDPPLWHWPSIEHRYLQLAEHGIVSAWEDVVDNDRIKGTDRTGRRKPGPCDCMSCGIRGVMPVSRLHLHPTDPYRTQRRSPRAGLTLDQRLRRWYTGPAFNQRWFTTSSVCLDANTS